MISLDTTSLNRILRDAIVKPVENELNRIGLLFRIFSRVKSTGSIDAKLTKSPGKYSKDGKHIQDLFGIRIALYFSDDISVVQSVLENSFIIDPDNSSIDEISANRFSATRHNLVFKLPESEIRDFKGCFDKSVPIDSTFEVQIRTIFSEGWHEVDHDLRYKHTSDWQNHDDLIRALNGILASLETSEWAMKQLFDDLSYKHYKAKEWSPMIRTKFRLRSDNDLDSEITDILDGDSDLAKKIFRTDRRDLLNRLINSKFNDPMNARNLILAINAFTIREKSLNSITPIHLADMFGLPSES